MSEILRVLQIEDSESDAGLVVRLLERTGYEVEAHRVENAAEMRAALEGRVWDVIIADYHLPQFDAPRALRLLQETGQDIPFIVVSARIGEDTAVEMMRSGAHDYLLKNNMVRLAPAVEREIRDAHTRWERRQAQRALELQTQLVNLSHDAIITADSNRTITGWNAGAQELYGWTESEAIGRVMATLFHTNSAVSVEQIDEILRRQSRWDGELVHTRRDGGQVRVESRQVLLRDAAGDAAGMLEINRDITDRRRAEERLRNAQRAESVGLLAGGIAHDFNNILTAVSGNIGLALADLCPECHVKSVLEIAIESVGRAARLTRQLLAYAGQGAWTRQPVSVSDAARAAVELMRQSIPKNVELRMELSSDLPPVQMDPSQLQMIFANLILNGVEAIGEKVPGTVTVSTGPENESVRIEVADTGSGMDKETQKRIFEPFFTTKFVGRGLGLAAVHGIVDSLKGHIDAFSAPGEGTRMRLLLPVPNAAPALARSAARKEARPAAGAVLIVDDEPAIRKLAGAMLSRRGIPVFEASTGRQAIECLTAHVAEIHAVLLDMTMPDMHGHEALPAMRKLSPGIRVVVSSGYSDADVKEQFHTMDIQSFLRKPYTGEQLLAHILPALGCGEPAEYTRPSA